MTPGDYPGGVPPRWLMPADLFASQHDIKRFPDVAGKLGLDVDDLAGGSIVDDFDGDGSLDIVASAMGLRSQLRYFRNEADGAFSDRTVAAGLTGRVGRLNAMQTDDDNDGRPDLYVSVQRRPNRLYRNDGPLEGEFSAGQGKSCRNWRFTDVATTAGVLHPIFSFPTWFWDFDNDGWEDLFVSGYILGDPGDVAAEYLGLPHRAELPRLYRIHRDGTFSDVTGTAGLARPLLTMGSNYGDFDNDGWLDIYAGTGNPDLGMLLPDRAFRSDGGKTFQDVTTSGGFGHLQKGHGVSFADIDNDGDQDIYHVMGGAYEADHFRNALFENPGHGRRCIALKLEGVKSNRPGAGARIKVVVIAPGGERAIHKTARSGGSFGASPRRQEIGLGDATGIRRVEIRWPSGGSPQVLESLPMDRVYLVREGEARATPLALKRLRLGGSEGTSGDR